MLVLAAALALTPCAAIVDEEYIREAEFVGIVSVGGTGRGEQGLQTPGLLIATQVYAPLDVVLWQEPIHLDFFLEEDMTWMLLQDAFDHQQPDFLESGRYSRTVMSFGHGECSFEISLMDGVDYLLILGPDIRPRMIEPIFDHRDDAWLDYVVGVLESEQ